MKTMAWLILGIFAVIVLYFMSTTLMSVSNADVTRENVSFAVNNTYYNLARQPVNTYSIVVHPYDNDSYSYPAAKWATNNTAVKLYTNGTLEYPNITVGYHYVTYSYQKSTTIWDIDFAFVALMVFLGTAIVIVMKLTSEKK